jgi:alpha-N-acetylglucosaminidase
MTNTDGKFEIPNRVAEWAMILTVVTFLIAGMLASAPAVASNAELAAKGVLERLIGPRTDDFILKEIPKENERDVFEIEAIDGKVNVSGSGAVAISRGAYEYLRRACACLVTWDGDNLPLPKRMPDFPKTRVVCPNKYRHCISVVTFSYTMLWWDWKRWEREIDWMALHGYNMPLALNGQEAVWQKVWKEYGFTDEELNEFFPGPAFLPWFRMGNLNGHAGPLPQSWLDSQRELQKKILARERELGMTPVTPAFAGFVPPAFAKKFPKANVIKGSGWYGFDPTYRLDPQDPLFLEIGKKFAEEYKKEFGADHFYLADTFMEMKPHFTSNETKFEELSALGDTIYKSITSSDPEGIWLMSGWAFLDTFWGPDEVKALFSKVPKEKSIILDLAGFGGDHWSKFDKQFIYCVLHNYGQLTTLFGSLPFCISIQNFYSNSNCKDMVGVGMTPEGTENNTVFFELLTDVMWTNAPIDLKKWVKEYAVCRYGGYSPQMEKAWEMITSIIYTNGGFPVPVYLRRPTIGTRSAFPDPKKMQEVLELFIGCSGQFGKNDLYKRDLVDLLKHYLDDAAFFLIERAVVAWQKGDKSDFEKYCKDYIKLLKDIELLVGTRSEYRLSRWINDARKFGKDTRESDFYEMNARMLLTVWGSTQLFDYSAREWSGLISNFYMPRFEKYFDLLRKSHPDKPIDPEWMKSLAQWELDWCKRTDLPKDKKVGDAVQIAKTLFRKYKNWQDEYGPSPQDAGIAVGKPVTISGGTNENHQPELSVDGNSSDPDSDWHAINLPQWICIDLEKEEKIDSVRVFTRWTNEVYKYTVEISADNKTWTMVADMSKNEIPTTNFGFAHKFKPTKARYVRLTALPSGTLPGIHLVEVRVFKAK